MDAIGEPQHYRQHTLLLYHLINTHSLLTRLRKTDFIHCLPFKRIISCCTQEKFRKLKKLSHTSQKMRQDACYVNAKSFV